MHENELSFEIIGAAVDVHRALGPGLLESVYEMALYHELKLRDFSVEKQKPLPVTYNFNTAVLKDGVKRVVNNL